MSRTLSAKESHRITENSVASSILVRFYGNLKYCFVNCDTALVFQLIINLVYLITLFVFIITVTMELLINTPCVNHEVKKTSRN